MFTAFSQFEEEQRKKSLKKSEIFHTSKIFFFIMTKEYPHRVPPYPFHKYRFHVFIGPQSLFKRIKYTIREAKKCK
jgi:hypothetical protein